MAAPPELTERMESFARAIRLTLGDLPEMAADWSEPLDAEHASWSLEWDHLMGDNLTELDEHARAGRMTAAQREEYGKLLAELARALPRIEQLNLYRPPVPLELPRETEIAAG
jgi:hypothetical protein